MCLFVCLFGRSVGSLSGWLAGWLVVNHKKRSADFCRSQLQYYCTILAFSSVLLQFCSGNPLLYVLF